MMRAFMRYCVVSIRVTSAPHREDTSRSISVRASPLLAASVERMVGGSWRWSPASSSLEAELATIQHAASSAWEHSSITVRAKCFSGRCCRGESGPDEVRVPSTTSARERISFIAFFSLSRISFLNVLTSVRMFLRSEFLFAPARVWSSSL